MEDRIKILVQISIVSDYYGLEIININFTNINTLKDEVEFTFKFKHDKFTINYSYEKDNNHNINSFGSCIKSIIDESIKDG